METSIWISIDRTAFRLETLQWRALRELPDWRALFLPARLYANTFQARRLGLPNFKGKQLDRRFQIKISNGTCYHEPYCELDIVVIARVVLFTLWSAQYQLHI